MEQTDELFVSSLINAYIKDNDDIDSDFYLNSFITQAIN